MKFSSFLGITVVAFTSLVYAGHSGEDSSGSSESKEITSPILPKVKLIKSTILMLDAGYYGQHFQYPVEVNETYSRFVQDYELKKDYPLDIQYIVTVSRSDLNCDNYEEIAYYTINLCDNKTCKYDEYLTERLLETKKAGKCLKKGFYPTCDAGFFRFDELLSEKQLRNAKFIIIRDLQTGDNIINRIKLEFVSNLH